VTLAAVVLIGISSCFLFAYGTNLVYLSVRAARLPRPAVPEPLLSWSPFSCRSTTSATSPSG